MYDGAQTCLRPGGQLLMAWTNTGKYAACWRLATLVFCLWVPAGLADDREAFESAYKAYLAHVQAGESERALATAAEAYRYGAKVFGEDHVNTANLAINYARLLNDKSESRKARSTLKGKLGVLEARYGDEAVELVPLVMQLARAAKKPDQSYELLERAAHLSRLYDDNLIEAQKNVDIMALLLSRGGGALVEPFVNRAYEIYVIRLPGNDVRRGLMAYHKARWSTGREELADANEYLHEALTAFKSPDGQAMGEFERNVREQIVQTFQQLEQPEDATGHLLALAQAQAWSATAPPVFEAEAELPKEAVKRKMGGDVSLTFTIDERGFVVDPEVTDSTQPLFNQSALSMVKKFRYVPRLENGQPVATSGVVYVASFTRTQMASSGHRFRRPPIKEMMLPDKNDIQNCGDPEEQQTNIACKGVGTF